MIVRRCPAALVEIRDHKVAASHRCELHFDHRGPHDARGQLWSFTPGSYYGIGEDSPSYFEDIDCRCDECVEEALR